MEFFYSNRDPLRVLNEIELWKHQEAEHTVVIRQIVRNLEQNFVDQLKEWEQSLAQAEGAAVCYIEAVNRTVGAIDPVLFQDIRNFATFAINQSIRFLTFLNQIKAESTVVRNNEIAVVVINHIQRESEYLIGIVRTALNFL